jgi:hypothetical protein
MTLQRKRSVNWLLRESTILHIKSQKRLIRKRIKPSINALMEREKVAVPPVMEL